MFKHDPGSPLRDPSFRDSKKSGEEVSIDFDESVLMSQEERPPFPELIKHDADELSQVFRKVRSIKNGAPNPGNTLNENKAQIQDIITRHLQAIPEKVYNLERDYKKEADEDIVPPYFEDHYKPKLLDALDNDVRGFADAYLESYSEVIGMESNARSINRTIARHERYFEDSEMNALENIRIGSSEVLDANNKVDLVALRRLPPTANRSIRLEMNLIQAKTTYPKDYRVKEIRRAHRNLAARLFQVPHLLKNFEHIKGSLQNLMDNMLLDMTGPQNVYAAGPKPGLLDTLASRSIEKYLSGEINNPSAAKESDIDINRLKEDIRTLLVLKKALKNDKDEEVKGCIRDHVANSDMLQKSNVQDADMVEKAILRLANSLNRTRLLNQVDFRIKSTIDASKGRDGTRYTSDFVDESVFAMYSVDRTQLIATL